MCGAVSEPSPSIWRPVELRYGANGAEAEAGWVATRVRSLYCPVFPQASAYGKCVQASTAPGGRLSKDLCVREFEALRSCFAAAAKKTMMGGS